jgi:hypothetical protein
LSPERSQPYINWPATQESIRRDKALLWRRSFRAECSRGSSAQGQTSAAHSFPRSPLENPDCRRARSSYSIRYCPDARTGNQGYMSTLSFSTHAILVQVCSAAERCGCDGLWHWLDMPALHAGKGRPIESCAFRAIPPWYFALLLQPGRALHSQLSWWL